MIKEHDRVQVLSYCMTQGEYGIVRAVNKKWITVLLDDGIVRVYNASSLRNLSDKKGDYDIMKDCLSHVTVTVGTSNYTFACYIEDIKEGDTVVCDTQRGLTLGKVVKVSDPTNFVPTREIVQKVDTEEFLIRKQKRAAVANLKAELQRRAMELQTTTMYEMLAEKDPEFAMLFESYKEATK